MTRLTILFAIIFLSSCRHNTVTEDEVYNLMDFVIKDQELGKNQGLELTPQKNCDLSKDDKEFLNSLVEEESTTHENIDWTKHVFELGLEKCLTKDDVEYMLQQKKTYENFKWNNSRLGFDLNNRSHWYVFSVPLFSRDKTKAVMMVRDLCSGLCGRGWNLLLKKVDGKWTSDRGISWWH